MEVIKLQTGHGTIPRDTTEGATSCAVPVALDHLAMCLNNNVTNSAHRGVVQVPQVLTCSGHAVRAQQRSRHVRTTTGTGIPDTVVTQWNEGVIACRTAGLL